MLFIVQSIQVNRNISRFYEIISLFITYSQIFTKSHSQTMIRSIHDIEFRTLLHFQAALKTIFTVHYSLREIKKRENNRNHRITIFPINLHVREANKKFEWRIMYKLILNQ